MSKAQHQNPAMVALNDANRLLWEGTFAKLGPNLLLKMNLFYSARVGDLTADHSKQCICLPAV